MAKGVMIAETRPSDPSRDQEYNDWYTQVHIPEILSVPGFVAARRYRVYRHDSAPAAGSAGTGPYVAVFEVEADDLNSLIGELEARAADGRMHLTDAIRLDPPPILTMYELIG